MSMGQASARDHVGVVAHTAPEAMLMSKACAVAMG